MHSAAAALDTPLAIGPARLPNRVFLAPMSGVTDAPFRRIAAAHGAGMVVSEMVASGELANGRAESARRLERIDGVAHVVQLAGRDAAAMAEATRIAVGEGAEIIDINMGCPAKKVTGGYCGAALMRDPDQAIRLVGAVVAAAAVPVTVKMRLGWDETALTAPDLARRAEGEGVAMITVHGRTRAQFYTGQADGSAIAAVRRAVTIPLVANGDVASRADAERLLALSGADAVMVGRAHYGQPWLAGVIAGTGQGIADLAAFVRAHYEAMLVHYGRERGLRHARKHLGWYADRFAPDLDEAERGALMTTTDVAAVGPLIDRLFSPDAATLEAAA